MKISKSATGNIVLKTNDGNFMASLPGGQYVHLHPRNADALFILERSNAQDDINRVVILASEVTEAFGAAFSGNREALAVLLSENF